MLNTRAATQIQARMRLLLPLLIGLVGLMPRCSPGDDAACPAEASLSRLIRRLESDDFQVRREARGQLIAAGRASVPELQQSAQGDSQSLAMECVSVLARLAHDEDHELARRATAALVELEQGASPFAARLAQAVVEPASPFLDSSSRRGLPAQIRINFQAGRIQGRNQLPVGWNGVRQVEIHSVNGKRTIEVVEANRRLKFSDDSGRQIRAAVTQTVDGEESTRTVEAEDLADLRAKAPDLADVFQQHSGGLQIRRSPPFVR